MARGRKSGSLGRKVAATRRSHRDRQEKAHQRAMARLLLQRLRRGSGHVDDEHDLGEEEHDLGEQERDIDEEEHDIDEEEHDIDEEEHDIDEEGQDANEDIVRASETTTRGGPTASSIQYRSVYREVCCGGVHRSYILMARCVLFYRLQLLAPYINILPTNHTEYPLSVITTLEELEFTFTEQNRIRPYLHEVDVSRKAALADRLAPDCDLCS